MGLRLTYRLLGQGSSVSGGAQGILQVVQVLRSQRLLLETAVRAHLRTKKPARQFETLSLDQVEALLRDLIPLDCAEIVLSGLLTVEQHPNLFWDYTIDERSLRAFLSIHSYTERAAQPAEFALSYSEVDFNDLAPSGSASLLKRSLDEAVGAFLVAGCLVDEASPKEA